MKFTHADKAQFWMMLAPLAALNLAVAIDKGRIFWAVVHASIILSFLAKAFLHFELIGRDER